MARKKRRRSSRKRRRSYRRRAHNPRRRRRSMQGAPVRRRRRRRRSRRRHRNPALKPLFKDLLVVGSGGVLGFLFGGAVGTGISGSDMGKKSPNAARAIGAALAGVGLQFLGRSMPNAFTGGMIAGAYTNAATAILSAAVNSMDKAGTNKTLRKISGVSMIVPTAAAPVTPPPPAPAPAPAPAPVGTEAPSTSGLRGMYPPYPGFPGYNSPSFPRLPDTPYVMNGIPAGYQVNGLPSAGYAMNGYSNLHPTLAGNPFSNPFKVGF